MKNISLAVVLLLTIVLNACSDDPTSPEKGSPKEFALVSVDHDTVYWDEAVVAMLEGTDTDSFTVFMGSLQAIVDSVWHGDSSRTLIRFIVPSNAVTATLRVYANGTTLAKGEVLLTIGERGEFIPSLQVVEIHCGAWRGQSIQFDKVGGNETVSEIIPPLDLYFISQTPIQPTFKADSIFFVSEQLVDDVILRTNVRLKMKTNKRISGTFRMSYFRKIDSWFDTLDMEIRDMPCEEFDESSYISLVEESDLEDQLVRFRFFEDAPNSTTTHNFERAGPGAFLRLRFVK